MAEGDDKGGAGGASRRKKTHGRASAGLFAKTYLALASRVSEVSVWGHKSSMVIKLVVQMLLGAIFLGMMSDPYRALEPGGNRGR